MSINYELNEELLQDCINIANGLFYPLVGFMTSTDYHSVVDDMTLSSGEVWTIPIGLDVDHDSYIKALESKQLALSFNSKEVGLIEIDDCYIVEIEKLPVPTLPVTSIAVQVIVVVVPTRNT